MFGTHPYLSAYVPSWMARDQAEIFRAADILGFDYVNGRAWEWTRYADVESPRVLGEFAGAIGNEAFAVIQHRRAIAAAERAERERVERERVRRRNSAAATLLLED